MVPSSSSVVTMRCSLLLFPAKYRVPDLYCCSWQSQGLVCSVYFEPDTTDIPGSRTNRSRSVRARL